MSTDRETRERDGVKVKEDGTVYHYFDGLWRMVPDVIVEAIIEHHEPAIREDERRGIIEGAGEGGGGGLKLASALDSYSEAPPPDSEGETELPVGRVDHGSLTETIAEMSAASGEQEGDEGGKRMTLLETLNYAAACDGLTPNGCRSVAAHLRRIEEERDRYREVVEMIEARDWATMIEWAKTHDCLPDRHGADDPEEYALKGNYPEDARYTFPARASLTTAILRRALSPTDGDEG